MKFVYTYLFLLIGFAAYCQNPVYFVLGDKAFANYDVYTLLYDDASDILYVGGNWGMYAYRQSQFQEIKGPGSQIGNSLFRLQKDQNGDVFCCNLSGQVFKIEEKGMELVYQAPKEEIEVGFEYFFDDDNNLLTVSSNVVRRISPQGKREILYQDPGRHYRFARSRKMLNGDIYIPVRGSSLVLRYRNGQIEALDSQRPPVPNGFLQYLSFGEKVFALSNEGELRVVEDQLAATFPPRKEEDFFPLNDHEILALDMQKGGRILSIRNDTIFEKQTFFDNRFLAGACSDSTGTLFIGTFGGGILVLPKRAVRKAIYDHLFLGIAVSPDNEVYISTRGGEIFQHRDGLHQVDRVRANVDKVFYLSGDYSFPNIGTPHLLYDTQLEGRVNCKDVYEIGDGIILVAHLVGVYILTDGAQTPAGLNFLSKQSEARYDLVTGHRGISVAWSAADSMICYSSNFGVFRRGWSSGQATPLLWKGKPFSGNDLEVYGNRLICGTEDKGLLLFEQGEFVEQISVEHGLLANSVRKVQVRNDLLYVLTKGGMQIYDLKAERFLGLGMVEGMVTERVSNFAVSEDKLWLLEKHSYYFIDLSEIRSETEIGKLYIDSVLVNDKVINVETESQFNYQENALTFYFDYRNIKSKAEVRILYQLEGMKRGWQVLPGSASKIEFPSLPIGAYVFNLKASYRDQETSTFSFSFEILPPYWQRWWFYALIGLVAFLLVALIAFFRIRTIRKNNQEKLRRKEIEKNALDAQLKALRAQMNPHFIFNSLNSIQDLVLRQETMKSYDYLVIFSKLVRNTLDYSDREFISLKEEIEFLEIYLSLEKLRFKDDFEYELRNSSPEDILVPSLIIQPFIENAIKHGLMHKDGAKKLSIRIMLEAHLICEITDNGVGREEAERIKASQRPAHKSFSMSAIQQRMKVLCSQYGPEVGFQMVDLKDELGKAAGTKVIVTLPFSQTGKRS